MKEKQIGFIGVGNMATAILQGILHSKLYAPQEIAVFDPVEEKRNSFAPQGVMPLESGAAVVARCRMVVLAVKPQSFEEVLSEIAPMVEEDTVLVSIAAGISTPYICDTIGVPCKVVRVMPNTPLLLGVGASALSRNDRVTEEEFAKVQEIFSASGEIAVLPESLMNAVISVNGSSPAYIYLFAKAMLEQAVAYGMDESMALRLIAQTLHGSAEMLLRSGDTPEELIRKVSSPGGTTLKALETLKEYRFEEGIRQAMESCTRRAGELGK